MPSWKKVVMHGSSGSLASLTLPNLTSQNVLGTDANGKLVAGSVSGYTLPTASNSVLGGVKVGGTLSITNGVLSARTYTGATPAVPGETLGVNGIAGYVPAATAAQYNYFLRGDGTWVIPTNTVTRLRPDTATSYTAGDFMITGSGATTVGYSNGVFTISSTDNDTTYIAFRGSNASTAGTLGLVPAPAKGTQASYYLRADGSWQIPPDNNTTYSDATTSSSGLMSSTDKSKLDGIASGANAYTLPVASSDGLGGIKVGSGLSIDENGILTAGAATRIGTDGTNYYSGNVQITGAGATTVTYDSERNLFTVSSTDTDTDTTYSAGTGLTLSGTTFSVTDGVYAPATVMQDSAPTGTAGKLWWETDTGILKIYSGSVWVDAVPMPDMNLYLTKAGGSITGDMSIGQTLTVTGNILAEAAVSASGGNSGQWNAAYRWGNHADAGYAASSHNHDSVYLKIADTGSIIDYIVAAAPGTLDTLNEIAAAIGDDANFSASIASVIAGKADASHTHNYDNYLGWVISDRTNTSNIVSGSILTVQGSGASSVSFDRNSNTLTISSTDTNTDTTYSTATSSTLGLVKIGYTANAKNYPVQLSSGQMYVNVPWTDTDTTYEVFTGAAADRDGTSGLVVAPRVANRAQFLRGDGTWATPTDTNTTYSAGTGLTLSGTTFSVTAGTYASASHTHDYLPLAGGTTTRMVTAYTNLTDGEDWANSPISLRERDAVNSTQSADKYSPNLNFHWANRVSKSLWMGANGKLNWGEYTAAGIPQADGTIKAATFEGALSGNATSATTATSASYAATGPFAPTSHTHNYDNYSSWTISDRTNTGAIGSGDTLAVTGAGATTVSYDRNTGILTISSTDTNTDTTYSQATTTTLGLVKIGYTASGKNYPVALDANGKMYVNVPWSDSDTTYSDFTGASASTDGRSGLVIAPRSANRAQFLRGDGTWATPTDTNTTYTAGTGLSLSGTEFSVTANTYAAATHGHAISDVTGLQTALDGKLSTSGTAAAATVVTTIQDTAPTGTAGKLWWESDTGILKVYYGSAWVDAVPMPDTTLFYPKAGGSITGDVVMNQTLTVAGNTSIGGTITTTSHGNSSQWDAAYRWGNHADAGYIKTYTDTNTVTSVGVTGDLSTGNITIAGSGATTVTKSGGTITISSTDTDTTYSDATTERAGLMSSTDKAKLDGIAANANNYTYTLPVAGTSIGGVKSGTDITVDASGNVSVNNDSHTHDGRYYTETEADNRFILNDFAAITAASSEDVKSGTWTEVANTSAWGSYKVGNDTTTGYAYNDAPGYMEYNIPTGYSTAYIGQLRWSSGGYFDVHAIKSDGSLIFRGRYLSLNSIENTDHGGDHDGQQIIKISGLDGMRSIRITNVSGRLHLQGIGWSKEVDTDGTQVSETHWDLIYGKPTTFSPSSHTHDDRYYTETEVDTLLAGKAASSHNHDDRYYTETEVNTLLAGKLGSTAKAADSNLLDGYDSTTLLDATDRKIYTSLSAAGTQSKKYRIGRVYYCPKHWDDTWQNLKLRLVEESYNASFVEYSLFGFYNGTENQTLNLKVVDYRGLSSDTQRYKISLGTHTDAGWLHSGQRVYYTDIYVEVSYYKDVRLTVTTEGHSYQSTDPTAGAGITVLYDSPEAQNIDYIADTKDSTYIGDGTKIWNSTNLINVSQLTNDSGYLTSYTDTNTVTSVGVTGDLSTGNVIIAGSGATTVTKSGGTITISSTDTDTTYGDATTERAGLMSSTDKTKLDGIAASANNYSLPVATASVLGGVKQGTNVSIAADGTISSTDTNTWRPIGTGATDAAAGNHTHALTEITSIPGWFSLGNNMIANLSNFNASVPSGFYQYSGASNAPGDGWYNLINVRHSNTANDHGFQIAASYYDENIWTRTYQSGTGRDDGTFTTWRSLVHSGNISSQSVNYAATAGSAPASDVYAWAKAAAKPTYTYSEVGAAAASHTHAISDVTGLQTALDGKLGTSGNAASATTFSTDRRNYKGSTDGAVAGQLMWKNYGNNHTIFDASAGTSPDGGTINRHTPDYPVTTSDGSNSWGVNVNLMGWNGSNTYGIKVDWSRYSENAGSATSAASATSVVTLQDTAPTGAAGKLWWETDTGKLKVYYGSAWVDASPIPDTSLYYSKAGGTITGDVTVRQTLTVIGNVLVQGTLTETSDAKLKENVAPLQDSLNKVMKLNGVSFNKIDTPEVKEVGFIAQEVEEVLPELVTETEDGIKTVSYSRVTAVLVETIKEQQVQINELKELVNKLTEKLNSL